MLELDLSLYALHLQFRCEHKNKVPIKYLRKNYFLIGIASFFMSETESGSSSSCSKIWITLWIIVRKKVGTI